MPGLSKGIPLRDAASSFQRIFSCGFMKPLKDNTIQEACTLSELLGFDDIGSARCSDWNFRCRQSRIDCAYAACRRRVSNMVPNEINTPPTTRFIHFENVGFEKTPLAREASSA